MLALAIAATNMAPLGNCVDYEIWKGGDDGLTNRVFDQLSLFNQGMLRCNSSKGCVKKYVLIATNVAPISDNNTTLISVVIEVYSDIHDFDTLEKKFVVECDVEKVNCASIIFEKLD